MPLLFPAILALFFGMVHYLAFSRVVRHLHVAPRTRTRLGWLLVANLIGVIGYLAGRYALSPPKTLYFLCSLSIGIGFLLFMGTVVYELLHLLQRKLPFRPEKRAFFKRTSDLAFLGAGSAYLGAGIVGGQAEPVVTFVDVPQKRFGDRRYRIVQISDLHVGGLIDRAFVQWSVDRINRLDADLVAITGDLCDARIDTIAEVIRPLADLKSRFGTYYVVGNHEYFHSVGSTIDFLKSLGIRVLENRAEPVDAFYVVGVYDLFGYRSGTFIPDIAEATREVPADAPTLLLAHQPKYLDYLGGFKPSLMLSGHTHGGQLWPFNYLVALSQPYVKGLHRLGENRHIYVNSGIGFWGPPMRLGSQAEITCITWS